MSVGMTSSNIFEKRGGGICPCKIDMCDMTLKLIRIRQDNLLHFKGAILHEYYFVIIIIKACIMACARQDVFAQEDVMKRTNDSNSTWGSEGFGKGGANIGAFEPQQE